MTTPRLGAPELTSGQATPETTVNEQIRYIESGAGHFIFKDRDLSTPPGSPADGDCYLVKATGTGAWSGKDGKIAFYLNTAWVFITVIEGFTAWVNDENVFIGYDGASWSTLSAPSGVYLAIANNLSDVASASTSRTNLGLGSIATFPETTAAQYQANTSGKALSTDKVWSAADYVALTDAATVAVDMSTGINFSLTIGGNRTLGAPSNTKNGQTGAIVITQDGTGSRTLAYHANWKFAGGTDPTLSTAAGTVDILFYQVISSTSIYGTLVKAIA